MLTNEYFGEKIKEERIKLGLSQTEFGKRINMSQSSVCCLENGSQNTTISTIKKICALFNCDVEDIFVDKKKVGVDFVMRNIEELSSKDLGMLKIAIDGEVERRIKDTFGDI